MNKVATLETKMLHTAATSQKTHMHNDSHIHWVSPIHGLSPEAATTNIHLTQTTSYAINGENHSRPQSTTQECISTAGKQYSSPNLNLWLPSWETPTTNCQQPPSAGSTSDQPSYNHWNIVTSQPD